MTANDSSGATAPVADPSTVSMFQQEWQTYRKMVENNFLFHREAYATLHDVLVNEVARPFRFLDVACGDAGNSAATLAGTKVTHYRGIDFSALALDIARQNLAGLGCEVALEQRDLLTGLGGERGSTDVVWIGLSLHHFNGDHKIPLMREARSLLAPDGMLLVYENTCRDGEDRDSWMARWDLQRPIWTAYTPAEWTSMAAHVHAADFPETHANWQRLGRAAGFTTVRRLFLSPPELFAVYCFSG